MVASFDVGKLKYLLHPGRYTGLLAALALLGITTPFAEMTEPGKVAVASLFTLTLLAGALAVSPSKGASRTAILSAIFAGALWIATSIIGPHMPILSVLTYTVNFIFVATVCAIIIRDVFVGDVTTNKLAGAICAYVLIGLSFGLLFLLADWQNPHSFRFEMSDGSKLSNSLSMSMVERFSSLVYLSFVTLCTLGYGDIVPATAPTRSMCYIEAIMGQSYMAILVARLVGLHIVASTASEPSPEDAERISD